MKTHATKNSHKYIELSEAKVKLMTSSDDIEKYGSDPKIGQIEESLEEDDIEKLDAEFSLEYTSGLVAVEDDYNLPTFSIRAVVLGMVWAVFLATMNTIGSFRTNSIIIPSNVAAIISYPMGVFLAKVLPDVSIFGLSLNPGPFSVKEHVIAFVISSAAGGKAYGLNNVIGQKLYFKDDSVNLLNSLAWIFSTQMLGYGISGILRRFLVKPTAMLWPTALSNVTFFNAFHKADSLEKEGGLYQHSISRYTCFWLAFVLMFFYSFLPAYFAPVVGSISVLCLIPGATNTMRFLGSTKSGPGILGLTFDWSKISITSFVYSPWYTTVNFAFGAILWGWIIGPVWHYTHAFNRPDLYAGFNYGSSVPIKNPHNATQAYDPVYLYNAGGIFDINGTRLKLSHGPYPNILDTHNNLNETAWGIATKANLTASFAMTYFCSFLTLGALFSHVGLWYGRDIYRQFRDALRQTESEIYAIDPHAKIMKNYKEISEKAYLIFFCIFIIVAILVTQVTPFYMPWWLTILCFIVGISCTIPVGVVQAITGYQPGLNIVTELIAGLLVPGQAVSVVAFKSLGYDIGIQALALMSDLKLGHYLHISPIAMVTAQLIGTVIGAFFNTFIAFEMIAQKPLVSDWIGDWSLNDYYVFVSAAGIWGAVAPARFFGAAGNFFFFNYAYFIGFALPFVPWLLNKYYPNPNWRLINMVLITAAPITMQTGNDQIYIVVPVFCAWYVQSYLYKHHREFWNKYAWIICNAFDAAANIVAVSPAILSFFKVDPPVGPFSPSEDLVYGDYYCYGFDYLGRNATDLALLAEAQN